MKSFIFAVTTMVFLSLVPFLLHGMGQEPVDAKTLFEKKCSACHSINRPKSMKKTNEEWTKTIMRMKEKTGNITIDEARIIIDYLTKIYGK
jgi:nitrate/TMAO reductase-like tetraheme cytochrome c subunit